MALLGDDQAREVRRVLLRKTGLVAVEAFPQKDDPRCRVFPDAKLSTAVFVAQGSPPDHLLVLRTHPGRFIDEQSESLEVRPSQLLAFDPENVTIPSCTQRDWDIAVSLISRSKMVRLGDYCKASQGEVNETTDGKKGFISHDPGDGHQILRGANICLYVLREASQGEPIFLKKHEYLRGKPNSVKACHHLQPRIGWQESSPQNNFRRIIAAKIPAGQFCNHKINYLPESDCKVPLDFVLAILNSKVSDWFFRLGSTNAAVSHYQIHSLPASSICEMPTGPQWAEMLSKGQWNRLADVLGGLCTEPGVMPEPVAEAIAAMSRRIQEVEANRVLKNRGERSRLAPESQPIQDVIDAVLFRCYGLSDNDAQYVEKRLEEML